jgi:hypothetical protein
METITERKRFPAAYVLDENTSHNHGIWNRNLVRELKLGSFRLPTILLRVEEGPKTFCDKGYVKKCIV